MRMLNFTLIQVNGFRLYFLLSIVLFNSSQIVLADQNLKDIQWIFEHLPSKSAKILDPSSVMECSASNPPLEFDEKSCIPEIFTSVTDGLPLYWAQRMLRPKEESLFLTPQEISRAAGFGIIDGGKIDYQDPSLRCIAPDASSCTPGDVDCHASCVASLICSKNECSISPAENSKLKIYADSKPKEFTGSLGDNGAATLAGIGLMKVYEYNQNRPIEDQIAVVNISMDFFGDDFEVKLALDKIYAQNKVNIVWGAGNHYGTENAGLRKNRYSNILPISALSTSRYILSDYSNYGASTAFTAPSDKKLKAVSRMNFSGTSGAAPLVSGALLTINKVNPQLSALYSRAILKATAQDIGAPGRDSEFGYGMPNIPLAAALARSVSVSDLDQIKKKPNESDGAFEDRLIYYLKNVLKSGNVKVVDPGAVPCGNKGINSHLNLVAYSRLKPGAGKVTEPRSCKELACSVDHFHNNYLLHLGLDRDRAKKDAANLCKIYTRLEIQWGIMNFCTTESLYSDFFEKPDTDSNSRQSMSAALGYPDVIKNPKWEKWMTKAIKEDPAIVAQYVLSRPEVQKSTKWESWVDATLEKGSDDVARHILSQPEVRKHPKWESWVEKALDNSRVVDRYVLSQPEVMKHPKWEGWVDKALKGSRNQVGQYVLSQPEAMKHPKWESWVNKSYELDPSGIVKYVLAEPEAMKHPKWESWMDKALQDNGFLIPNYVLFQPEVMKHPKWASWAAIVLKQNSSLRLISRDIERKIERKLNGEK